MRSKTLYLASLLTIIFLALLLAATLPTRGTRASPGILYVSTSGNDAGDCTAAGPPCRTVQRAIHLATTGDEIRVATGTYTDTAGTVVEITETITLQGGWSTDFTARDPDLYPTTLDAQGNGRVIYISGYISPTVDGFIITGGQAYAGAGLNVENASPIISHNVITDNIANHYGGGIRTVGGAPVITANAILSNSAGYGGGGALLTVGEVTLHGNRIAQNEANYGAGVHLDKEFITASANLIVHNQGSSAWSTAAQPGDRIMAMNNIVANNSGVAFDIYVYQADLLHNTIVSNGGPAVQGAYTATITMTNNVIANHAASSIIAGAGATVSANNNLFWNNSTDPITGTNAVLGAPAFVNSESGDYHIGPGSAAIDAGVDAGVTTDIDGDPRPFGAAYDIGADESRYWYVYLPVIMKNY